jgi:hypothetical protein
MLQIFDGNNDRNTVVSAFFETPVKATFMRIRPTEWHDHISMRFEVVGSEGNMLYFNGVLKNNIVKRNVCVIANSSIQLPFLNSLSHV